MLSPELMQQAWPLLAAVALSAIVFVLIHPYVSNDRARDKRVKSVAVTRTVAVAARTANDVAANRRKAVADTLKDLENKKQKQTVSLRMRLEQAGLDMTARDFWMASGICGLVLAGIVMGSMQWSATSQLAAVVAGFVGMFGLPRWVLGKMTQRRQSAFLKELANAIDVVVRGVKSGLPLHECLAIIARESPKPICDEFREVVEQQRIGVSLNEALERMVDRMPLAEVKFLTIVIAIQQQAGGNLSEALGNLSSVLRDRANLSLKVKALSSEATTSAMVLGCLPPGVMLMVQLTTPDFLSPLFTTKSGTLFICASLFWMGCGVMVMRWMINFKY